MQISVEARVLARLLQCVLGGWVCFICFWVGEK